MTRLDQIRTAATRAGERVGGLPRWLPLLLAGLLTLAVLSPVTHSGMRGDDSYLPLNFEGQRKVEHQSLPDLIYHDIKGTLHNGRPQIVGVIEGDTYFGIVHERLAYKAGIALGSLLALFMLLQFLRLFRPSASTLLAVTVAFVLSLQFRFTHDPALGYYSTPQFIMITFFGGLICYLRFLRGGSMRWYAATLALVAVMLGTYEANYPLVAAFAALHLGRDPVRRRSWTFSVPILVMGALMTLLSAYMHSQAAPPPGYETGTDPVAIVLTALRQAVSGIPDIYFLSGSSGLLADPTKAELFSAFWRASLTAALIVVAFLWVRRERPATPVAATGPQGAAAGPVAVPPGPVAIAGVGFVLMAGSGLFISLATQWQQQIVLGTGHLATFSCTLGFVLIAAAAWIQWGRVLATQPAVIAGAAVVVFGMAFAGQYSNLRVIAIERPGVEQRQLLRATLSHGLLRGVPDRTTLYMNNRDMNWPFGNLVFYGSTSDYLFYVKTNHRYDVRLYGPPGTPCGPPTTFPFPDCAVPSRQVGFVVVRASPKGGAAILAAGIPAGKVDTRGPRALTVLAHGVTADGPIPPLQGNLPNGKPWSSSQSRWTRTSAGGGWVRYTTTFRGPTGPLAQSINDPRSHVDFTLARTPGQTVRLFGTKDLLP